jgi:chromate reductase, NAD(P)H dehydrogenase (quinone)
LRSAASRPSPEPKRRPNLEEIITEHSGGDPPPAPWTAFRQRVEVADAVLFVTSELKNALDVGSRPYGSSVWDRKPAAIVSSSPGPIGAFGANHHLRQSLVFLNLPTMQQPEAYVGHVDKLFDEHGKLDDGTRKFRQAFMQAFANWVETIRSQGQLV